MSGNNSESYINWSAKKYLHEYYNKIYPDESYTLKFIVEMLAKITPVQCALEFGCGPTFHHALPMSSVAEEIHLAELLPDNRRQIDLWLEKSPEAFNWNHFTEHILRLEGEDCPGFNDISSREDKLRGKIAKVLLGDALVSPSISKASIGFYPLVASHYCAEASTSDIREWSRILGNIAELVAPGGHFLLSTCSLAGTYSVGDQTFPCAGVRPHEVLETLRNLGFSSIELRVLDVPLHTRQGNSTITMAFATRENKTRMINRLPNRVNLRSE